MANRENPIPRSHLSQSQQALLERRLRAKSTGQTSKQLIPPRSIQSETPTSFAQQRLWLIDQLEPGKAIYNVPMAVELKGQLNIDVLEKSIAEIVRRHEILRTTFEVKDEMPVQVIHPAQPVHIKWTDLSGEPEERRKPQAQKLALREMEMPFDLKAGPLLRASLIRLDENEHVFLVTFHHIICDGWSIAIFLQELNKLYSAYVKGEPPDLEKLPIQYADFAVWQREWLSGKALEENVAYWKTHLAGLPPILELPLDRARPAVQNHSGATFFYLLPQDIAEDLKLLAHQERVTLFMTILSAFQVLLYRYTRQENLAVGVPIANRNILGIEKLIGFFVNTLVMKGDLSDRPTFLEFLRRIKEIAFEAYAHQDVPFEKLVEELQPERRLDHSPFFQVLFALQNNPTGVMDLPNLTITSMQVENKVAKFDLSLTVNEKKAALEAWWTYNTDIFDEGTIRRMAANFETVLRSAVSDPNQNVSTLPFLSNGEQKQVLMEWNNTREDYPQNERLHRLFEAQVERTPERTAVVFEGQKITYKELNARSNRLARYLQSLGVGPDVIVQICVNRSVDMIVALLGTLKAGGAYMPFDPRFPKDRMAAIMEEVESPVLLTEYALLDALPTEGRRVFCLDSDWGQLTLLEDTNLHVPTELDNIMAVIQTSGSTGLPKGTMITERGLLNLCLWYQKACPLTDSSGVLLMTAFSFDAAFKNIMTPLICGGRVILANSGYYDAEELLQALVDNKATMIFTTPSQIYPLLDLAAEDEYKSLSGLQCLIMGGEATLWAKLRPWYNSRYSDCRVMHMYGPAECSITISSYEATREKLNASDNIPIGKPLSNSNLYVLDPDLNLLPIGVPGELCASGEGITRGYLNKPDLTAAAFVPNPFQLGQRMYRTGDMARWTEDGNLEFLGRLDHQVKIRGQRIEVDEIRAVINQHPQVQENIVVAREHAPGDKRLIAYAVSNEETIIDVNELRVFLRKKLPEYMVPHYIMQLESLPMLSNGKVNRQALPDPNWNKADDPEIYTAPRNDVEMVLARIWAELLGIENVGIYDDFFQRGGHSLLATQLVTRISSTFDILLPLRSIFEKKRIADLATLIEEMIIREIMKP